MTSPNNILLIQDQSREKKDVRGRIQQYVTFLTESGKVWYLPDLDSYRDFLLYKRKLMPNSVSAHIGTIRVQYRELLADETLPATLATLAPVEADPAAFIADAMAAMQKATSPESGRVSLIRTAQITHLTRSQVNELFLQPNIERPDGVRDLAAMGLILCAGINENELSALRTTDVHREAVEHLSLQLAASSGKPARTVLVYDHLLFDTPWLAYCLDILFHFTRGSTDQLIPGFTGKGTVKKRPLTPRGVQKRLERFRVHDAQGQLITVPALDLRRTYARRLFMAGVDLQTIQANLGQTTSVTTLEYIGPPDAVGEGDYGQFDGEKLVNTLRLHHPHIWG